MSERIDGAARREAILAGHRGDAALATERLSHGDPGVHDAALGALDRMGRLGAEQLRAALADESPVVRRRAVLVAARHRDVDLLAAFRDPDPSVVEVAAWACGEHERVADDVLAEIIALATDADDVLVRESAAAALGAIGDPRGLPAILRACEDKPQVRRRAVLALAPFEGDDVEAAIDRALDDRDWQVRQAAEDLRRASGELDLG